MYTAHPVVVVVTAKAQSQWKTLEEAQRLLHKIGTLQRVSHFLEHGNPADLDFTSNSKKAPQINPKSREFFLQGPLLPLQLKVWAPSLHRASYSIQESWRKYTWWSAVKETHRLREFTVHTQGAHNPNASPWVRGLATLLVEYPSHFLVPGPHAYPIGKHLNHLR